MARRAAHTDDFARWRRRFREQLAAEHGEGFADECIAEVDADVGETGGGQTAEDRLFLEIIIPGLVANNRRFSRG